VNVAGDGAASRPLRILQLYPKEDYFTGAAIQLRELAWGLARRGHEVTLATRPSDVWAQKSGEAGITHYPLPMASEVDLRSVARLVRIIRHHRVQIVHAQKGKARTLAMLAGLFVRIPVLILNRGVSFPLDPFNRLGYTTRRVTGIVAVCDSIRRGLVASGVDGAKIHVIYSGTDTTRFHPGIDRTAVRKELGLGADVFLFTQIGVRSWKGNDDVIDALALVAPHAPHAHLLIVGARRPESLLERARSAGVEERVHVWGYREDVPEILAASDCCVDASYAGLGLTGTLREALAVETAVIGTAIEGNPELVIDGETGLLVPPRQPGPLAAAMRRMMAEPALRQATARAGRRLVEARFSTRAKLDATEALYRRLLAEGTRRR
jgi:glycosyltransferase involved in cell wall biosynthesis